MLPHTKLRLLVALVIVMITTGWHSEQSSSFAMAQHYRKQQGGQ